MACVLSSCQAQPSSEKATATPLSKIAPLKIGDMVPGIVFHHMLNYKDSTAKLSDFKEKLVILDFWNTWCGTCIEAFPKMNSLQKHFGDKIQILLVNAGGRKHDGEERVKNTFYNLKKRTGFSPDLPISILDTSLNDYFPHKSVPHEIWIDTKGRIIGITGIDEVSASNIQSFLRGEKPNMEMKNDWSYDRNVPLLVNGNGGGRGNLMYRSVFTAYRPGISNYGGWRKNDENKVIGFYQINASLISFIHLAYPELFDSVSYRTVFNVKNMAQYKINDHHYYYCYDLIIPPVDFKKVDLGYYLREDLKRTFNINVKLEQKKLDCWILSGANQKITQSYTKYSNRAADIDDATIKKYIHNWSLQEIARLFEAHLKNPILNETDIIQNLDVNFPVNFKWSDKEGIIKILKNTGFNIKKEQRVINVASVTDR